MTSRDRQSQQSPSNSIHPILLGSQFSPSSEDRMERVQTLGSLGRKVKEDYSTPDWTLSLPVIRSFTSIRKQPAQAFLTNSNGFWIIVRVFAIAAERATPSPLPATATTSCRAAPPMFHSGHTQRQMPRKSQPQAQQHTNSSPPMSSPPAQKPPDKQWATLTPTIVLTALATATVTIRLFTRWKLVRAIGFDDYVISLSLLLSWTVCGLTVAEVQDGIGAYAWTSALDLKPSNAKIVIAWNGVYVILINVTKASILMQYLRIFCTRTMRVLTFMLLACLVPALLWGILGGVLLCSPVHKLWEPHTPGHCMSLRAYWLSTASINIVLDFATMLLPMPAIWGLRLPRRQKLGLLFVFLLGFFVCGVSLARVALVHLATMKKDWTDASTAAFTWSTVEANTGIICASLLALKPFVAKLFPNLLGEPKTARHSETLPRIVDDDGEGSDGSDGAGTRRNADSSMCSSGASTLVPYSSMVQTLKRVYTGTMV